MRLRTILATVTAVISVPVLASAQVPSINAPPSGPGTETPGAVPGGKAMQEGFDISGQIGAGFTDTYGLGLGARAGYTVSLASLHAPIPIGAYVGGSFTYYFGHNVTTVNENQSAHAMFIGGEAGVKVIPAPHWEVRPYVFLGPAFIKTVSDNPFVAESKTSFAVAPSLLGAYHFGNLYLSGEARWYVTPDPNGFTLLGGVGYGFE